MKLSKSIVLLVLIDKLKNYTKQFKKYILYENDKPWFIIAT